MKNQGRNPDLLMESVQPVLDAQGWYLRSSAVPGQFDSTVAFASENFTAPFLLSTSEEWLYVHYAFGLATTGGGPVLAPNTKFVVFQATPGISIFETDLSTAVVASATGFASSRVVDLWIPPGFGLVFIGDDLTPALTTIRVGALVSRVRV